MIFIAEIIYPLMFICTVVLLRVYLGFDDSCFPGADESGIGS
jgi:hypothetical protein